jgi:hypothetical protein
MTHFTEMEFIDLLEGSLPAERARHADACGICRTQIEHLRAALASGANADVPEPSPLFWEHFARRVDDGIASAGAGRAGWLSTMTSRRAFTAAGAIAALVLIAVITLGPRGEDPSSSGGTPVVTDDPLFEPNAPGSDDGWAAVRAAAENVARDDAREAGLAAQPDAADRAIDNLTETERARLLALLAEDLKKSGE